MDVYYVTAAVRGVVCSFIIAILAVNIALIGITVRRKGFFYKPKNLIIISMSIGDIFLALFPLIMFARKIFEYSYDPGCSTLTLTYVYWFYLIHFVYATGLITLLVELVIRARKQLAGKSPTNNVVKSLVYGAVPWISGLIIVLPLTLADSNHKHNEQVCWYLTPSRRLAAFVAVVMIPACAALVTSFVVTCKWLRLIGSSSSTTVPYYNFTNDFDTPSHDRTVTSQGYSLQMNTNMSFDFHNNHESNIPQQYPTTELVSANQATDTGFRLPDHSRANGIEEYPFLVMGSDSCNQMTEKDFIDYDHSRDFVYHQGSHSGSASETQGAAAIPGNMLDDQVQKYDADYMGYSATQNNSAQPRYPGQQDGKPQHLTSHCIEPQYRGPQYTASQYHGPQYRGTQYREPQYGKQQHGGQQYSTPQYQGPQIGGPQYPVSQYQGQQHGGPQYPPSQHQGPQYSTSQSLVHEYNASPQEMVTPYFNPPQILQQTLPHERDPVTERNLLLVISILFFLLIMPVALLPVVSMKYKVETMLTMGLLLLSVVRSVLTPGIFLCDSKNEPREAILVLGRMNN